MKKTTFVVFALIVCMLSACTVSISPTPEQDSDPVDIRAAVIKGPSSIGMIQLLDEADKIETNNYTFEIAASADEIVPKIVQGNLDIAAVPPNMASVLYNNTEGGVQVVAIGTLGMMYVVEKGDSIQSIEDLRGKTIYCGFKGKSPEYDLAYILSSNGIDPEKDVTIEWKSEHTECVTAVTTSENAIAVLPQPFVTVAQTADENIRIALDLNKEWNTIQESSENPSAQITGVVVARKEFVTQNPAAVKDFLERYAQSAEYVAGHTDEAAVLVGKYEIIAEAVAKKAIPYCNITFIEGTEMKEKLSGYLKILHEQNPQSVGGTLPNDDFYFVG